MKTKNCVYGDGLGKEPKIYKFYYDIYKFLVTVKHLTTKVQKAHT